MKNISLFKILILLTILCLCQKYQLNAQNSSYIIKTKNIAFTYKAIDVPQIYSIKGEDTLNLEAINEKIINRFAIIPNAPKNETDYDKFVGTLRFFEDFAGYLDIKYSYKIKSDYVEINIEGNYVEFEGKPAFYIYKTYNKETFYINIDNNELFYASGYGNEIKLKYFFEPKEYLELLSNTWIPRIQQIKKKYPDDIEYEYACDDCASSNAYLHPFEYEYEIKEDSLFFFLESVAYYRDFCYQKFCSPQIKIAYPTKHLTPLFKDDFDWLKYNQLDQLSKIVFYKENIENYLKESKLISGKIDGKYSFLMVLNFENKNNINGHYMYTSNHKFIELRGRQVGGNKIEIIEYLNNESTGKFELEYKGNITNLFEIKNFKWNSTNGKKSFDVEVEDFEIY